MTTRTEFLSRIRTEVGKTPGLFSARTAPCPSDPRAVSETIKRELAERWPQALERFQLEFERVAGVSRARTTCGGSWPGTRPSWAPISWTR